MTKKEIVLKYGVVLSFFYRLILKENIDWCPQRI